MYCFLSHCRKIGTLISGITFVQGWTPELYDLTLITIDIVRPYLTLPLTTQLLGRILPAVQTLYRVLHCWMQSPRQETDLISPTPHNHNINQSTGSVLSVMRQISHCFLLCPGFVLMLACLCAVVGRKVLRRYFFLL